jgi:hypothetical protein
MYRENSANGQVLILLINDHSERVNRRTITCATTVCCHCGMNAGSGQTPFAFHGTRARRFLVLVGSYVCKVPALLARWRCPHCCRTFTDYPSFACPHKAYTLPQMTERAAKYVSNAAISYRKGVCSAGLPIFYAQVPGVKSAQYTCTDTIPSLSTVAHTSLFRWVTALGRDALRQLETLPADFAPASRKWVSKKRRSILIACRARCSVLLSDRAAAASPC